MRVLPVLVRTPVTSVRMLDARVGLIRCSIRGLGIAFPLCLFLPNGSSGVDERLVEALVPALVLPLVLALLVGLFAGSMPLMLLITSSRGCV